jgi:hypothetical protein
MPVTLVTFEEVSMRTITYDGHKIEVSGMSLTGMERVLYDGREVSSKHSVTGSTHMFRVNEHGEDIQYEVELRTRWHGLASWCTVRRKGEVIYSDR